MVTLKRTWAALGMWDRVRLLYNILLMPTVTEEDVEKVTFALVCVCIILCALCVFMRM